MPELDHVFVCCARGAPEAERLARARGEEDREPLCDVVLPAALSPAGLTIEVAEGTTLQEPEIFFLPWARRRERGGGRQAVDGIPIAEVTGVTIRLPETGSRSAAVRAIEAAGAATFVSAGEHALTLAFDREKRGSLLDFRPQLPLTLRC